MSEVRNPDSAPPLSSDPIAPLRIALRGRYEFERQIGQGAFATVYLARDLKHERKVAIKVLNADPTSETGEIRFIREIRLVARLQHPNILPLHDSGHVEALLYYVMPFVEGETLRIRMHRERQMAVESACAIARETADALAYAHKQGIVHRDIKPENILLSGGHAVVADFGIARAIDVAGVRQLTATGVAGPGTPAYMSPEQLLGDRAVDARSDIYSLGCVLYEMLVARPPYSGKDGFVKRFTEPPPHISSLRRDSPPWLDQVIGTALAKDPSDRYATAADFIAALHQPTSRTRTPAHHTPLKNALVSPPLFEADPLEAQELAAAFPDSYPSGGARRTTVAHLTPPASGPRRWLAIARANPLRSALSVVAVFVMAGVVARASNYGSLPAIFGATPATDSTLFVVLSSTETANAGIGPQVADSLYDAFTKWEGLPVVPETRVAQAIADGADHPATETDAIALARLVGAGRAVWVQTSGNPPALRVRIHLYDARSAESLDEFGVQATGRNEEYYAAVAQRLLGMGDRPRAALGCDGRTQSFRAWSACSRGHASIAEWNASAAERSFREAVSAHATYAPARVWLAQLITWRGPERRSEAHELVRDLGGRESLSQRDQLVANGLTAFLEQRFPAACAAYKELTKRDSSDFVGWYGLGECQFYDSAVVRAPSSPSEWAFRSSWHSALDAYTRALRVQPGAHEIFPAARLQTLMPVSSTVARTGVGDTPERPRYRAYATLLSGDTIGFVPYPAATFGSVQRTAAADAALRRNTALLDAFTTRWVERFPRSFRAQEARADALEARLELGDGPPRESAALRALDSALSLLLQAPDDGVKAVDLVRLRARKIRIHFKRGEFAAARSLADSLLASPAVSGSERELQWVAALTGRADLLAAYWQRTLRTQALTGGTVSPGVALPASRYFSYAALGVCGPALLASADQLESALRTYITPDIRAGMESDLADRAASLATPCTEGKSALSIPATGDKLWLAQQAFGRGDVARVRALLAATAFERRGRRPADTSVDYVFHDAWLRAQVGDTSAAVAALDAALGALPTFSSTTIRDPAAAASFGRMMALRAEIAAKKGDTIAARRWGTALGDLWRSADPALRRVVTEIRSLGAGVPR